MIKVSLPLPTTAGVDRRSLTSRLALSKRSLKLVLVCALVLVTLPIYSLSPSFFGSPSYRIDMGALDRILDKHASSTVVGAQKPNDEHNRGGLTVLGLEADQSFHIGSTNLSEYRTELEEFVINAFPKKLQQDALASVRRHLDDNRSQSSLSPIPHKIWQTAKINNPNKFPEWQYQAGFEYTFMNDHDADVWMKKHFQGSLIWWTWQRLPSGILRSDYLRYVVLCFEGGIYSDTDTRLLKSFDHWGANPEERNASPGPASLIVGIEADVGDREDWHQWWPRPLQICQWTIASAPFQPALIDTLRRVYERNLDVEKWKKSQGLSDKAAGEKIRESIKTNELVGSVMEWTGPGVFTDATVRFLTTVHGAQWPALKDRRKPTRYGEAVVLPVTGFSPGVGLFGAEDINHEQAMVHHWFSGTWKHD